MYNKDSNLITRKTVCNNTSSSNKKTFTVLTVTLTVTVTKNN